jgi:hypothetical protein
MLIFSMATIAPWLQMVPQFIIPDGIGFAINSNKGWIVLNHRLFRNLTIEKEIPRCIE